jgi:hypothetical protein
MQHEITQANPHLHVQILGVNKSGEESGNETITENRTLPWLQDTEAQHCWTTWAVTWRDVVITDAENRKVAVFNLTQHGLHIPSNYDSLKAMILEEASR